MRWLTLPLALALGVLGCSSSSQSAGGADAGTDSDIIGCSAAGASAYPLETYSPGMGQMGTGKVFRFVLADASPPPTSHANENWTLKVLDASGKPVTDATFPVMHPWMPQHKHGTSTVGIMNNPDGTYALENVNMFMAGIWEIDITAQSGTTKDSTSFYFCLD